MRGEKQKAAVARVGSRRNQKRRTQFDTTVKTDIRGSRRGSCHHHSGYHYLLEEMISPAPVNDGVSKERH